MADGGVAKLRAHLADRVQPEQLCLFDFLCSDIPAQIHAGRLLEKTADIGGAHIDLLRNIFQPDFAGAVLKGCRKLGLHTCLDTSGHLGVNAGEEMLADTDLVLLDIKAWNPKRYRALTGGELRPTLEFAERLASLRKPVWLRYVLVPGVTDNLEEIEELSRHAALLGNVERVDVLPFHQLGRFKWDELKLDYTLKDVPEASAELAEQVRGIFRRGGFPDCVH